MKALTVVGANTMVWINPSTTIGFRILRAWMSQAGTATSEDQQVTLFTQPTSFPTVVSQTPRPHKFGDPASGITGATTGAAGTCGVNASAENAGAKTHVITDSFNNLNGWLYIPTPLEILEMGANIASGFGLFLASTPTGKTLWSAGITYEEMG